MALCRLLACHTMARNMADISGTSVTSSMGCAWRATSMRMNVLVVAMTAARVKNVHRIPHTRKP